jgi:hypothetical protein
LVVGRATVDLLEEVAVFGDAVEAVNTSQAGVTAAAYLCQVIRVETVGRGRE